mgnify:CR=1 FL=1
MINGEQVLFIDLQTTGHSPEKHHIIEIGWKFVNNNRVEPTQSKVINIHQELSKKIKNLTGISSEECSQGENLDKVWSSIIANLSAPKTPCIIHYSQFEVGFLKSLPGFGLLEILCTHKLAKRFFPQLPSKSLRSVAGYLGHPVKELKRSGHHIDATYHIWKALSKKLHAEKIHSTDAILNWLETPNKNRNTLTAKQYALPKVTRLSMPTAPGIYKMLNSQGEILYIGKAKNLNARVNSYFRGQKSKGSRLNELTSIIHDIEPEILPTATHAALREYQLIKEHRPPYNIALKNSSSEYYYFDSQFMPGLEADTYGPFKSSHFFDRFEDVCNALTGESTVPSSTFGPPPDILSQAVKLWEASHSKVISRKDLRHHIIEGYLHSVEKKKQLIIAGKDSQEEDETKDDFFWTPDIASIYIQKTIAAFGYILHHSRWLNRLSYSNIFWCEDKVQQHIELKGDTFHYEKVAGNKNSSIKSKNLDLSLISILKTELMRMIKEEKAVFIRFTPGKLMTTTQIRKYIFPELS